MEVNRSLPINTPSIRRNQQEVDASFQSWDAQQVGNWLTNNNFAEYKDCFIQHSITGDLLLDLNYTILRDIGVLIVGDRARILQAIKRQFVPLLGNISQKPPITPGTSAELAAGPSLNTRRPSNRSIPEPPIKSRKAPGQASSSGSAGSNEQINLQPPNSGVRPSNTQMTERKNSLGRRPSGQSEMLEIPERLEKQDRSDKRAYPEERSKHDRRKNLSEEKSQPLMIFPRTSSRKDSNVKSSPHQDLYEAVDSVFGSIPSNNPGGLPKPERPRNQNAMKVSKPFSSEPSLDFEQDDDDNDIMNIKGVREVFFIYTETH
jgi:hypothetical protein